MRGTSWIGGLAALGLALVLAGCAGFTPPSPSASLGDLASLDEKQFDQYQQAFFELTLWYAPYRRPAQPRSITKFEEPVRLRLVGLPDGDREFAMRQVRRATTLAGLDLIMLSPEDLTENYLIEFRDDPLGTARTGTCYDLVDRNARGVMRPRLLIPPYFFRYCFTHELMHGLGFGHAHSFDSAMSYVYQRENLTELDELLLRVLYDKRLKAGTDALTALSIARKVLAEKLIEAGAPAATADMGRQFVQNFIASTLSQAEGGNVAYQSLLGFAYTFGGTEDFLQRDVTAGYKWFRRAAEAGDVRSQANVGYGLTFGRGVEKDESEGYRWFRKAAEAGHADAQFFVGSALRNGRGISAEPEEGVRWYRLAADSGHTIAQNNLGMAYRDGIGVTNDPVEAIKWLSLAADKKYELAQSNLEKLTTTLPREQIDEGRRRAASWMPNSSR